MFLRPLDRKVWLAGLDRRDPLLLVFAEWLVELSQATLEQTGRELKPEHAAILALQLAADTEPENLPLAA